MAMQSQSTRSSLNRGGSRRRRRFGRLPMLLVLAVVAGALVYLFWPGGGGDSEGEVAGNNPRQPGAAQDADGNGVSLALGDPQEVSLASPAIEPTDAGRPAPEDPAPPAADGDEPNDDADAGATLTAVVEQTRAAVPPPRATPSDADAMTLYNQADAKLAQGDRVGGRRLLSQLLFNHGLELSNQDAMLIRNRLTEINQELVFSPEIAPDDPIADRHMVQSGEYLMGIGAKYKVPYQFLEVINDMSARNLIAGKPIKVIDGPIHARIIKHQFLMDLYANGDDGMPVYICSFKVGLGKGDKTPAGAWEVAKGKVQNPDWRDDQSNEYYPADDPDNPIGEYWIPIDGIGQNTRSREGFGIHGTIDPQSIGTQASRGCIRLADEDIELAYYMLSDLGSMVRIVP